MVMRYLVAIVFIVFPSALFAQWVTPGEQEKVVVLSAYDFQLEDPNYVFRSDGYRRWPSGPSDFRARINLPDGALITAAELEACNSPSATTGVHVSLSETCDASVAASCQTQFSDILSFQTAGTCGTVRLNYYEIPEANNRHKLYWVTGFVGAHDGSNQLVSVRVYYKQTVRFGDVLQTPSFADVPTDHPFYNFVESLYRSGATGGCGRDANDNLLFCPDRPLTRGEAAVLLTKIAGLFVW
jgi:hypothetical protein